MEAVPLRDVDFPRRLVDALTVNAFPDSFHCDAAALRASANGASVAVVALLTDGQAASLASLVPGEALVLTDGVGGSAVLSE